MKLGWIRPSICFPLPPLDGLITTYSPCRVLTTEYADWAEMDPNQPDQNCVRIWEWSEAEDSGVGKFEEALSWGTLSIIEVPCILLIPSEYDGRPMGIAFNPDRTTWRQGDGELSMCAIGCGSG
jgi:hypothetical protein